jgi:cytochrome c oxidase cbb3-type subunit 3
MSVPISDMSFEELIIAAMQVSQPQDLEKLKSTFPDLFVQYEARLTGTGDAELLAEAAPAEPEPELAMLTDDASLAAGKSIYIANCATCHGQNGEGGIGPNMTDDYFIHGAGMNNTVRILNNGVPAKGMIAWRGILKEEQILQVSSYVLSLRGTEVPNGKAPQGELITSNE